MFEDMLEDMDYPSPDDESQEEIKLTKREERAIKRLQKLANTWPQSLLLFSQSGTLLIIKPPKDDPRNPNLKNTVASVPGIPNDGGDADSF